MGRLLDLGLLEGACLGVSPKRRRGPISYIRCTESGLVGGFLDSQLLRHILPPIAGSEEPKKASHITG